MLPVGSWHTPLTQVPPGLQRFPLRHAQPGCPLAHAAGATTQTPALHESPALHVAPGPQTHPAVPAPHPSSAPDDAGESLLLPQPVSARSAHATRKDQSIRA